jgi:hypothetical protein
MKHLDAQLCVVAICKNLIIKLNFMEKYVFNINSGLEIPLSSIFPRGTRSNSEECFKWAANWIQWQVGIVYLYIVRTENCATKVDKMHSYLSPAFSEL